MLKNLMFIFTSLVNYNQLSCMLHSLDHACLIVVFFTFISAKFSSGVLLLTLYYPLLVVVIWYFGSIKLVANVFTLNYTLLNLIMNFLFKFPLNSCIFGFSFLFNYAKIYITNKRFHGYIFSMFTVWKCKTVKELVSYDNSVHITKHLQDTLENIGHLHTTQDEIKRNYYREKLQHALFDLHKDHPNGIKQLFSVFRLDWFNKKYNCSIFRNDPTSLPMNWEGTLYNLYDKTPMNNQNAKNVIEEGSTNFALKLYKELSEKQNVPLVHHLTDAFAKDYLSGKEKLGNKPPALAYDESMYNTIQEGSILDKYLTESEKSYKQISRLDIRKNDGIVLSDSIIPYKEGEPYSLPTYEEAKNRAPDIEAYEIKSTTLFKIRDIVENDTLRRTLNTAYNEQERYSQLGFPVNFLFSIDRPNMTNKEKEIIEFMFNKMVKDNKGRIPNTFPTLRIDSKEQDILLIKDSWIKTIVDILENI
jgi:hypothetical protein